MKRLATLVVFALFLASCNSDKPKIDPDAPKKTTPVPSDMGSFNDFLPSGGGGAGLAVKVADGGLEGGLASAGGDGDATGGPDSSAMRVTEQGAEPRAVRKYTFAANKTDRRTLTIRQSQSIQGQKQETPGIIFTADFTVKEVKAKGATIEMKVAKVDIADKEKLDPRAVQQVSAEFLPFVGLTATFEASSYGDISDLAMAGSPKMQRESAAEVLQAFQLFVELALPSFPAAAIGQGAKWERDDVVKEQGVELRQKRTFELKEITESGGTVHSTQHRKLGKQAVKNPRMPPGATLEMDASGSSTYTFRFAGVSSKVVADQLQTINMEVPGQGGQPGQREKQTISQSSKYVMETPAAK